MFGRQAFESWWFIGFTAICFGTLFGLIAVMGEALFDGNLRMTRAAVALGAGATVGYVAVAYLVRRDERQL